MKTHSQQSTRAGFTLMETVIAIGVIALLITGFIAVFTPAVDGIRRAISTEEADRLTSTLERELVTLRGKTEADTYSTGFNKAFKLIEQSDTSKLIVYQYRGALNDLRDGENEDNTPTPVKSAKGLPGEDFIAVPMMRQLINESDPLLKADIDALEGRIFVVRCTQLVYDANGALTRGTPGQIINRDGQKAENADAYREAVLPFAVEFFSVPNRDLAFIKDYSLENRKPMFTRNLAVRR